jgi:hypothetical protein
VQSRLPDDRSFRQFEIQRSWPPITDPLVNKREVSTGENGEKGRALALVALDRGGSGWQPSRFHSNWRTAGLTKNWQNVLDSGAVLLPACRQQTGRWQFVERGAGSPENLFSNLFSTCTSVGLRAAGWSQVIVN